MKRESAAVAAALLAVGVLSAWTPDASRPGPDSTSSVTASERPTASEAQVAAVVGAYETDWRVVISGADGCRERWENPGEDANASCYLREQTIAVTSQLALRDWERLVIPNSMSKLVSETSDVFKSIGAIDLVWVCGEGAEPNDSKDCETALQSRAASYRDLRVQLDRWRRYQ